MLSLFMPLNPFSASGTLTLSEPFPLLFFGFGAGFGVFLGPGLAGLEDRVSGDRGLFVEDEAPGVGNRWNTTSGEV